MSGGKSQNREEQWVLEEKYGGNAEAPGFAEDKRRLALGEPAAYVIGHQPFLGLTIYLDTKPLIPRPETEWWAEELLRAVSEWSGRAKRGDPRTFAKGAQEFRFLDLCAGSGAIGCAALARLPNATVYFGEIEPAHETTIRKNIRENGLDESRADIRIGDLFEPFGELQFDVIAINPPYIPSSRELPESVAAYEPARALYAGADGLEIIRKIAAELPRRLRPRGIAWIECDTTHAETACDLFTTEGFSAQVRADQYGVPRVLVVAPSDNIGI